MEASQLMTGKTPIEAIPPRAEIRTDLAPCFPLFRDDEPRGSLLGDAGRKKFGYFI
ncbi:MAG: hypothetical protein M0R02_14685 [Bacteroidales bacterium]|nr:hypothetical protein [Bacteroidales bacterium]